MPAMIPAISFSARFFLGAEVEELSIPVICIYLINFPLDLGLRRHSPVITGRTREYITMSCNACETEREAVRNDYALTFRN